MKTLLNFRMIVMGLIIFLFAGNNLTAQTNWVKYADNPVMDYSTDDGAWDRWCLNPTVLLIDSTLSMWYLGTNNGPSIDQIGYAYSEDGGYTWISNEDPVIYGGNPGDWNEDKTPNTVILVGDTLLKMWYTGWGTTTSASIGYAWRHIDDTEWTLNEDPVLEAGSSDDWDGFGVWQCSVHFDGEIYHMWYQGWEVDETTAPGHMGYATSADGEIWNKHSENPVMLVGPSGSFYDTWIMPGPVHFNEGQFEMYFTGYDGNNTSPRRYDRIGFATSGDGIEWNPEPNHVVDVGSSGDWDQDQVSVSSVVYHDDTLKMFFMGHKYANGYQIGLATEDMVNGVNDINQLSEFEMIISPNPSKDITTIYYHLATASNTSIVIYNQQGQIISTLLDEKRQTGDHEIKFDSKGFPSGVYFCVLKANDEIQTAKIVKL